MLSLEARSLEAVGKLEAEFPYAATLLVYVVLERCLKLHLLQSRHTLTEKDVELAKPVGRKSQKVVDFKNLDDACFIRQFLENCTLGALEIIYRVPERKYSDHRNKVFHSDLYMKDQLGKDDKSREAMNRQYLETAKMHLIEASELYFRRRIIKSNGVLRFQG